MVLAECLARKIKEDTSNMVASDPWKPLKTPEMVDIPEKVCEKWDSPRKDMKTSLLKLVVRNNDIESQKSLYKAQLPCLQECFRKYTDREGI